MRIMYRLSFGVLFAVALLTSSVASADRALDAAVHKLHAGIHSNLCKLNKKQYGEVLGLGAEDLVERFNSRSNPHAVFDAMVKSCLPDYREALIACSYNINRCAVEENDAPPVMPGLTAAVPTQYPLPSAQGPVPPVPATRPGATALDPSLFDTYVKCWAERHPGTTFTREDVLNGVNAKATAENMPLPAALAALLNGCNSAPRAPLAVANAAAPTTVTAQGGVATASSQTNVGQQTTARLSAEQLATAQAQAVHLPLPPPSPEAGGINNAGWLLWRGAQHHVSYIQIGTTYSYGFVGDGSALSDGFSKHNFATGLRAGFRIPHTPFGIGGALGLFLPILSDISEEYKGLTDGRWRVTGDLMVNWYAFYGAGGKVPNVTLSAGYRGVIYPGTNDVTYPHSFLTCARIGPLGFLASALAATLCEEVPVRTDKLDKPFGVTWIGIELPLVGQF